MEFYRLGSAEDPLFAEAFALYEISFPKHEQRFLAKQTALMANPLYHFVAVAGDGGLAGILLYWKGSAYVYIEHFAIHPAMRSKAMGSRVLEAFCRKQSSPVVLEIDPLVDETARRRQRFYQRLGFAANVYPHLHPAYQPQFPPHELVVMSYPRPMDEREYQLFRRELEETVMKDCAFQ